MQLDSFLRLHRDRLAPHYQGDAGLILRQLVAHRLKLNPAQVMARPERELTPDQCKQLGSDVDALIAGTPSAYVFGEIPFLDWEFKCDSRALIPRPETEALAEELRLSLPREPASILDVCCGSGVLGLSLALHYSNAAVVLTDISAEALALAQENLQRHQLESRVRCFQGDLWEAVPPGSTFDLIVANPPYVAQYDRVEPSVLNHEPHLALFSGEDGTHHIRRILTQLDDFLNPNGWAAFELGHSHHQQFLCGSTYPSCNGRFQWRKDPFGVPRYLFYDCPAQLLRGSNH